MKEIFVKRTNEECFNILKICQSVLEKYKINFDIETIRSESRENYLVFIRSLIAVYLRKRGLSYFDIAIILNRKTHATIMNLMKYGIIHPEHFKKWNEIINNLTGEITKSEIENKIKYHEQEIQKLNNKIVVINN